VNVRIPVGLIRAGMKLRALVPAHVADDVNDALEKKGIHFDIRDLKDEYLDELITALRETEINVDSEEAVVSVRAE
jgi:protein tyrosine/serine phosphatase